MFVPLGWAADVQVGGWRDGVLLQLTLAGGDNWKIRDAQDALAKFMAAQAVGSYFYAMSGDARLSGVEPLVRVSMGDPDIAHDDDGGAVVTPGLMFYLGGKNKIGANVDIYSPQSGNTECSFKVQMFLYFYRAVRSPPGTSAPPQGAYDVRGPVCTR
jgi:hypothetical protein